MTDQGWSPVGVAEDTTGLPSPSTKLDGRRERPLTRRGRVADRRGRARRARRAGAPARGRGRLPSVPRAITIRRDRAAGCHMLHRRSFGDARVPATPRGAPEHRSRAPSTLGWAQSEAVRPRHRRRTPLNDHMRHTWQRPSGVAGGREVRAAAAPVSALYASPGNGPSRGGAGREPGPRLPWRRTESRHRTEQRRGQSRPDSVAVSAGSRGASPVSWRRRLMRSTIGGWVDMRPADRASNFLIGFVK